MYGVQNAVLLDAMIRVKWRESEKAWDPNTNELDFFTSDAVLPTGIQNPYTDKNPNPYVFIKKGP